MKDWFMNLLYYLKRPFIRLSRFRYRCGYGVHSPFAFSLITDVIYEKMPYYAYDLLKAEQKKRITTQGWEKGIPRINRLLFRLVNKVQPATIIEVGQPSAASLYLQSAKPSAGYLFASDLSELFLDADTPVDFLYLNDYRNPALLEEVFNICSRRTTPNSLFVVHGICYSKAMKNLWKQLQNDERVGITFDLYDAGLLFFDTTKIKISLGDMKNDLRRIEKIRLAVGPDMKLAVDSNQSYDAQTAMKFIREAYQYDIAWYEEPIVHTESEEIAKFIRMMKEEDRYVPVDYGESARYALEYKAYMDAGVEYITVMPSIYTMGEFLKITDMVRSRGCHVCSGQNDHPGALMGVMLKDGEKVEFHKPNTEYMEQYYRLKPTRKGTRLYPYTKLINKEFCPIVYEKDCDFTIGKSNIIKKGEDVAILATGLMVREAMDAAEMLKEKNVNATVVDMYTIKPLDTGLLDTIFSTHRLVVTVEEHNIIGGLGSSIAEYKCDNDLHVRLVRIGVNDRFGELGSLRYIWKQHGLTAEQIASKIEFLLK